MTVKEYLSTRPQDTYNKRIRVLDQNKKFCGRWYHFANKKVISVKVTTKIIFIFIQKEV